MNKKTITSKILKYAKKIKAVNHLGGKCYKCGEKNVFKLTFHHRDPNEKEFSYNNLKTLRWSIIKNELDKCDLLCQNCHRELHYNENLNDDKRRDDKLIYLEYSGGKCIKCGYNKCPAALTFHHRDPNKKEFWIGGLSERLNSISELDHIIKNEIDKCDLLCSNCHSVEHSDIVFFNENYDEINSKSLDYIEPEILDYEKIYDMYNNGERQVDIIKKFKAPKSTINTIIKKGKKIGKINR